MPQGHLSVRVDATNRQHHLWNNNGVWWVHYTLNFDCRTRRVRRSLKTGSLDEAIRRRDDLFARLRTEGEDLPERATESKRMPTQQRWFELWA
jgi:hypothetical protein